MSYQDLRSFLKKLEEENLLIRYEDEISLEPDVRAVLSAAMHMEDPPAVVMDNIKGFPKGTTIVGNVHASWKSNAIMLGMDKNATIREQFFEMADKWDHYDKGSVEYMDNPPCQEVVIEENINLFEMLPLHRINKNDGGMYLSKALTVTKDPDHPDDFDKENVGIYRIQVQHPSTIALHVMPFHDGGRHIRLAEERNEAIPIAVCIGVPPIIAAMAASPLNYDESEYKFASVFDGKPFKLAKCIGSDLDVPAYSEYVLEGRLVPRKRFFEGPFGEFPGSYSGAKRVFHVEIERITHRKNPIFETLYIGRPWTEHDTLIGLSTSVPIYKQLKETMPEVKCVNANYQHGLTAIVATDLRFGGYGKTVAMRVATTPHGISYCKNIIVVDGDVDPFNMDQVMWALNTRVRADKDVTVIQNTPGFQLDPTTNPPGMGNKLIIDATTPEYPDKIRDFQMIEKVDGFDDMKQKLEELRGK
ncbi:MAG: UbiD family decarboxylase [Clostridiales bacterium]|nr:UbiD family decarboxylase [Clostridiales bacterium]